MPAANPKVQRIRKFFGMKSKGKLPAASKILTTSARTPGQMRAKIRSGVYSGKLRPKDVGAAMKAAGVRSFPGTHTDGRQGLFTQSVKGMKPKKYIEKAMSATLLIFKNT